MTIKMQGCDTSSLKSITITTMTIQSNLLSTSRLINNKMIALEISITSLDDMIIKATRLSNLLDEVYCDFSRIARESIETSKSSESIDG